jgi:hypothetical protein
MDAKELVKAFSDLVPIVSLVVIGFAIVLRSGVTNPRTDQGLHQMAGNLSKALLVLAGCLVGILLLQQLSGVPMGLLG